ncbi:hypothetical protein M0804_010338 [Polistes exclamans]|nr:hypothetical protein M0804_010338 [Polistes exclamans]
MQYSFQSQQARGFKFASRMPKLVLFLSLFCKRTGMVTERGSDTCCKQIFSCCVRIRPDSELCISLGLSLQYLRVSVVCWLAAMCHHLYATVASIPRRDDPPTYLKYSVFAWGAPLITLAVATLVQSRESNDFWNVVDLTPFNCWFLGTNATVYAYGLPIVLLLLVSGYYLVKAAIVSRYTCSMQLEIKQREKMKRRRTLQLMLFLKVSLIVGLVAACGVASRIWKMPFLWAIFCTGHSLQITKSSSSMQLLAPAPDPV